MKLRQRQSGMSLLGMLFIAAMLGFFIMCAVRLVPPYAEYLSVKKIVQDVAVAHNPSKDTLGDIRRKIANMLNTNQVYGLQPNEVAIYRKSGNTYIDANYEVRVPIMGRIDAVLKFDDLVYIAGSPVAQPVK